MTGRLVTGRPATGRPVTGRPESAAIGGAPGGRSRIALATAARLPAGMADTPGLVDALGELGAEVQVLPWDAPDVDWTGFGVVMTHCTWDYLDRREEFRDWLRCRHREGTLANPLPLLESSFDKAYLLRLADRGIAVPATLRLERGTDAHPEALRDGLPVGSLVVKPAVGGGGHRIRRCADADEAADIARTQLPGEAVLVQEFQPSVMSDGEFSAVFVRGRLSHAVRKLPQNGDFRVHRRYGAIRETVDTRPWMAEYGRRVLSALGPVPLYARVDFLLPAGGAPVLMELELLEPDLYLREHPGSASRLATALVERAGAVRRR